MLKTCPVDGEQFEGHPTATYCSARCKKRAQRGSAGGTVTSLPSNPASRGLVGLVKATTEGLEAAGRLNSPLGAAALLLATQLDGAGGRDSGGGIASLMREWRATYAEAVLDAEDSADALDKVRQSAALKLIG